MHDRDLMSDWLLIYSLACLGMRLDLDIYCLDKYQSLCTTELLDKISLEQTFAYGRTYGMI
jgi:hypothetical protein